MGMPFTRPTLQEINDRIKTDLETRLSTSGSFLKRAVVLVLGRVLAGASHLLHGHLDFNSEQIIPDTAIKAYLVRWASIWGINRKAATFSAGPVTMTGTNGSVITAGSLFTRDDGAQYEAQADATIAGGTIDVTVQALLAGVDGDLDPGVELNLVSPIAGVDSTGTVAGPDGVTGGNDEESDEDLLGRLLDRLQTPPLGGADQDYEKWAKEVAGVTRVWVYPLYLGPGTVGVTFVRDDDDPIIPDNTAVGVVADYIETKRPVTAHVTVFAPVADPINFTIHIEPDSAEIRAAIEAELKDMIFREGVPAGTILLSHMNEAISIAKGEVDHVLSSPVADQVSAAGHLAQMGVITWV